MKGLFFFYKNTSPADIWAAANLFHGALLYMVTVPDQL